MQDPDNRPLAPHYYHENFLRLCQTVLSRYADMLCEEEVGFLDDFSCLSFDAQCLYIRLVSRVGPWFRESKLHYPELDSLPEPATELMARGFVEQAEALSCDELGQLFTRQELMRMFNEPLLGGKFARKEQLLCAIDELGLDDAELLDTTRSVDTGRIFSPLATDVVLRLQILFFGNRHQSLTEFVLEDLGLTRYFPYPLARDQRMFTGREAFEEYLDCAALADSHYEAIESGDKEQLLALATVLCDTDVRFTSTEKRWHRLLNNVARDLERLEEWNLARALYATSRRHPARERMARIMEKTGDWSDAIALCTEILAEPWCEGEQEAARRILPRLQRKLSGATQRRKRDQFNECQLRLPLSTESVELVTAAHLAKDWSQVHYVENTLMNGLFGLAFWEQIFAAIPGAFHNAYQSVPADMYERDFYDKRRASVDRRMQDLRRCNLAQELGAAWQKYAGYQCRWLNWRYFDEGLVNDVLAVIPAEHLLAIWERILFDPQENRSGFPDLIALGDTYGDYCMIEVKGPGDALQDSQKRWLRFFQGADIPAQVAWVTWSDD